MNEGARGTPTGWLTPATGVLLLLLLVLFALLKTYSFRWVSGDEHLYNYMSLRLLDGEWPYRDFFFSHPPLPICLTALLFSVTGYSIVASKCVPIIAAMSSGAHVYLLGRRTLGPIEGLLAAALFLFTFDVIRGSSHPTGANVAVAFILAGTYQVFRNRPVAGGILLAGASLTGVYAVPMMLMLLTLLALRSFREAGRFALGWGCVMAAAVVLFAAMTGSAFWYDIVTFNLNKRQMSHSWYSKFENVAFLNFHLMAAFLPALVWGGCRWFSGGREASTPRLEPRLPSWSKRILAAIDPWGPGVLRSALLFATFALGYLYFYSTLKVYYSYYFMLVMPWMALLAAFVIVDVPRMFWANLRPTRNAGDESKPVEAEAAGLSRQERRLRAREAEKRRRQEPAQGGARSSWWFWPAIPTVVALLLVFGHRERIGEERIATASSLVRNYGFVPSPYLGDGVNDLVEKALWTGVRDRRDPPRGIARYLQHETIYSRSIDRFDEAVRAACRPGDRIFGEYSLAPYGAAISDCSVAANIIDTNGSRLSSGESTMAGWIDEIEADGLDVVVWRERTSFSRNSELSAYVLGTFPEVVFEWKDSHMGTVEIRRRTR